MRSCDEEFLRADGDAGAPSLKVTDKDLATAALPYVCNPNRSLGHLLAGYAALSIYSFPWRDLSLPTATVPAGESVANSHLTLSKCPDILIKRNILMERVKVTKGSPKGVNRAGDSPSLRGY